MTREPKGWDAESVNVFLPDAPDMFGGFAKLTEPPLCMIKLQVALDLMRPPPLTRFEEAAAPGSADSRLQGIEARDR